MSAFELLLLDQLPDVGPVTVRRLVTRFGSGERALTARRADFAAVAGTTAADARGDPGLRSDVSTALKAAEASGMEILTWNDAGYPTGLRHLVDPPPVLFLQGRRELVARAPTVTVVGARRSTARARSVAERLGAALGRAGVCVVSGLALGVDGAAHAGALRAEGDTVAVLGAGADVPYPRFHRSLHERIAREGLLVTEFPPGMRAAPHHFPRRNRILAALARAVVVVEAGRGSGSLITVDHALDLGRDVWAVPGPIDVAVCAGSNRLLVDGARPLVSIDDFVDRMTDRPTDGGAQTSLFVEETGAVDDRRGTEGTGGPDARRRPESLETRVLDALREGPTAADELAARFGAPISTVLALLTTLELHGEVERVGGMRFRRAA